MRFSGAVDAPQVGVGALEPSWAGVAQVVLGEVGEGAVATRREFLLAEGSVVAVFLAFNPQNGGGLD